ncbi:GTP-binding protein [Suillus variegatus]|nr:GTP-binding protein [Suillus variegatus]
MDPAKIREKIGRFRILVIGRANAGKTTILQRVCNTRDNPKIYNNAGKQVGIILLLTCSQRGLHDIENEMVFESNQGFIFHDSRGFEAGGTSEFEKVKYCIPMDEACRSFTAAEKKFFSECDTGSIPVIVLFTKFDALYDVEFNKLRAEGRSRKDAKELAPKQAEESFPNGPQLKFLKEVRWPPKCHVCLSNMEKDDADCRILIERTAGTLDNEVLQQIFVSTQQTNLEICMKYAVEG